MSDQERLAPGDGEVLYQHTIKLPAARYEFAPVRRITEKLCHRVFVHQTGLTPTWSGWRFEKGYVTWLDNGDEFTVPDLWAYTCEAIGKAKP